jgi:DnaJ family protein C protein 25
VLHFAMKPPLAHLLLLAAFCAACNAQQPETADEKPPEKRAKRSLSGADPLEDNFDPSSTDWGTYHDPQNIFCGKYDCYKILGFDYESYYKEKPAQKTITRHYRSLSREWHPDKSKHKDAKERFVKIARAYEVLNNIEVRKEYDSMRYDVEKYYQKYGSSVLWSYAPKTDTTIVLLVLLIVANVFSWVSQKHRWQLVADRLIKAAVEDWSPSMGGTPESRHLREDALLVLAEKEKEGLDMLNGAFDTNSPATGGKTGKKVKGVKKLSGKEKKKLLEDQLRPIIVEMVREMHDFGAGFHKPTWRDLMIVSLFKLPIKFANEFLWFAKYSIRRIQGKPLSAEERQTLTERAVGPIPWETASDDERKEMIKRELWVVANLAEWSAEQDLNKLSAAEKKEYLRMKKKGVKLTSDDFGDE